MKRVCNRPVQLDAVSLCYEVVHPYYYEQLSHLEMGERLDVNDIEDESQSNFRLYRTEGRYFENVYVIKLDNGTRDIEWGYLKFNLARGDEQSNTHQRQSQSLVQPQQRNSLLKGHLFSDLHRTNAGVRVP